MAVLKSTVFAAFVVMLALISKPAGGDGNSTVWKQEQLTETYMRSLSKEECMKKTVETLKAGCDSERCMKTMAGVMGDCVTWASGDLKSFCNEYDKYIGAYCFSNYLDARRCTMLHVGKTSLCEQEKK